MPVSTRETPRRTKKKPATRRSEGRSLEIILPTEPSEPISSLGEATILLYGEKKIGKTSFASKFPNAFFFAFEPGYKGLRIIREPFDDWRKFVSWVDAVVDSDLYETLVIDTVDICYERCFEYVCKREGVKHPSDGGYGKVWDAIKKEFRTQLLKLINSGRGIIFISHAQQKDFLSREGDRYDKLVPSAANAALGFTAGIADLILYYGYFGDDRLVTIAGGSNLEAGQRLEERFWTVKGDRRIHSISMGDSAQEGYDNFLKAFNNEQRTSGRPKAATGLEKVAPMDNRRGR